MNALATVPPAADPAPALFRVTQPHQFPFPAPRLPRAVRAA